MLRVTSWGPGLDRAWLVSPAHRNRRYPAPVLLAFVLLLAGVAVGVLRGGSLDHINRVRFRLPWLVFLGLGLQIGAGVAAARLPQIHRGLTGPPALPSPYPRAGAFVPLTFPSPGAPPT